MHAKIHKRFKMAHSNAAISIYGLTILCRPLADFFESTKGVSIIFSTRIYDVTAVINFP